MHAFALYKIAPNLATTDKNGDNVRKIELCSCEIKDFYVAIVQFRPVRRNSTFRRHGLTSVCFFCPPKLNVSPSRTHIRMLFRFHLLRRSTAQTSKVWRWRECLARSRLTGTLKAQRFALLPSAHSRSNSRQATGLCEFSSQPHIL